MTKLLSITLLAVGLATTGYSQTNPPTGGGVQTLWGTVTGLLDLNNTNSLIHAQELNLTPLAFWDSKNQRVGGGLKADWWVTDQQGVSIGFTEFNDRSSFWSVGYQARTVFKGLEVSLGTGVLQSQDDTLGDVRVYLSPAITYQLKFIKFIDARLHGGDYLVATERPSPFVGVTFRFFRE